MASPLALGAGISSRRCPCRCAVVVGRTHEPWRTVPMCTHHGQRMLLVQNKLLVYDTSCCVLQRNDRRSR
jgi:hypothetical protein